MCLSVGLSCASVTSSKDNDKEDNDKEDNKKGKDDDDDVLISLSDDQPYHELSG